MQTRSDRSSSWYMENDRLGYPGISQQESLYPFGIEERSPISKILTNSTGIVTPGLLGCLSGWANPWEKR